MDLTSYQTDLVKSFNADDPSMWLKIFSRPVKWMELDTTIRQYYLEQAEQARFRCSMEKEREIKRTLRALAMGSFPILVYDSETYHQMRYFAQLLYRKFEHRTQRFDNKEEAEREAEYWDRFFNNALDKHDILYVFSVIKGYPGRDYIATAAVYHVLRHEFQRAYYDVLLKDSVSVQEILDIFKTFKTRMHRLKDVLLSAGHEPGQIIEKSFCSYKSYKYRCLIYYLNELIEVILRKMRRCCLACDFEITLERIMAALADLKDTGFYVPLEIVEEVKKEQSIVRSLSYRLVAVMESAYRNKVKEIHQKTGNGYDKRLVDLLYSNPNTERSVSRAWDVCLKAWLRRELVLPPEGVMVRVASSFLKSCGYLAVLVRQRKDALNTRWWLKDGNSFGLSFVPSSQTKWESRLEEILALYAFAVAVDACCRFNPGKPRRHGSQTSERQTQSGGMGLAGENDKAAGGKTIVCYPKSVRSYKAGEGTTHLNVGKRYNKNEHSYQVRGHFRRLLPGQKTSQEALENAFVYAGLAFLPEGFTFVKPHVRGGFAVGPDKFSATIYAQSVAYLLDLCAAEAASTHGMDPKVFGFEFHLSRSGRFRESFVRVGDPLGAAERLYCPGCFVVS